MNAIGRGLLGGLAGTAVMSATMVADRALGWMTGEVPPRKIGRARPRRRWGSREHLSPGVRGELGRRALRLRGGGGGRLRADPAPKVRLPEPVPAGPAYGAALWVVSYVGLMPMAGLYPPPTEDRPERLGMIFVHHLVYGTALATACRWLRSPRIGPHSPSP